jgi:hypothetical protein
MQDSKKDSSRGFGTFAAISVGVLVVWLGFWWFVVYTIDDTSKRGQFGDMFGAVNALFSGLAFAGIIFTILLQRDELRLQRKELRQNRLELRGQKLQLQAQTETLRRQNFESTFFQLLRLHNNIVASIDLRSAPSGDVIAQGRDCFKNFYSSFRKRWGRALVEESDPVELERIRKTYLGFYAQHEADIGHYFRSLYNIVKFVDSSPVEDKRLYTNLVRAQLSTYEVALLFYNALSPIGEEKFQPLIEKYALLKMTPFAELMNRGDHEPLYPPHAYGRAA